MNKKIIFLCAVLPAFLCGCGQSASAEEETPLPIAEPVEGTFDIDAVRTHISIKGYPFTVPQKLAELPDGLRCELVDEEFDDGLYESVISDENGIVLRSIARNAHRKSKKAELYNIAVDNSSSSVAGIIPLVSTEEDVLRQFGEPDTILEPEESYLHKVYKYGTSGDSDGYQRPGKFMNVVFDESGVVDSVIVNYLE